MALALMGLAGPKYSLGAPFREPPRPIEPPMDLGPKDPFAGQSRGHAGRPSSRPRRRKRSGLHPKHPRRRRYARYQRTGGGR